MSAAAERGEAFSSGLAILCPMRAEVWAVRRHWTRDCVYHTGVGRKHSLRAAARLRGEGAGPVAVAGWCGGLVSGLEPGSVIAASEVRSADGVRRCDGTGALLDALRALGLEPRSGPILSVDRVVRGHARHALRESGALAVDMESAWLAEAAPRRPFAALRVVLDAPGHELLRPGLALAAVRAWQALRLAAGALVSWGEAVHRS